MKTNKILRLANHPLSKLKLISLQLEKTAFPTTHPWKFKQIQSMCSEDTKCFKLCLYTYPFKWWLKVLKNSIGNGFQIWFVTFRNINKVLNFSDYLVIHVFSFLVSIWETWNFFESSKRINRIKNFGQLCSIHLMIGNRRLELQFRVFLVRFIVLFLLFRLSDLHRQLSLNNIIVFIFKYSFSTSSCTRSASDLIIKSFFSSMTQLLLLYRMNKKSYFFLCFKFHGKVHA